MVKQMRCLCLACLWCLYLVDASTLQPVVLYTQCQVLCRCPQAYKYCHTAACLQHNCPTHYLRGGDADELAHALPCLSDVDVNAPLKLFRLPLCWRSW